MKAQAAIGTARTFRGFAKHVFTVAEWLTISAAIQYAALKTQSLPLWLIAWSLQLTLVIYVLFTAALWIRPKFRGLQHPILRGLAALAVTLFLTLGANWVVTDTVHRLVRTQFDLPRMPHADLQPDPLATGGSVPARNQRGQSRFPF